MNTDDSHERTVIAKASEHILKYLREADKIDNESFGMMFPSWQNADVILFPSAIDGSYASKIKTFLKGKNINAAVALKPSLISVEPFGESRFTELISVYD